MSNNLHRGRSYSSVHNTDSHPDEGRLMVVVKVAGDEGSGDAGGAEARRLQKAGHQGTHVVGTPRFLHVHIH